MGEWGAKREQAGGMEDKAPDLLRWIKDKAGTSSSGWGWRRKEKGEEEGEEEERRGRNGNRGGRAPIYSGLGRRPGRKLKSTTRYTKWCCNREWHTSC
jgi:hypothetical protein